MNEVTTMRQPYTDPLTLKERVIVRYLNTRYDWRQFWQTGLWQGIAHKLPRRLAYFAMVRVVAHAWADAGNKTPDELTYEEICKRWEGKPVG